jgi:hypothetical protein
VIPKLAGKEPERLTFIICATYGMEMRKGEEGWRGDEELFQ